MVDQNIVSDLNKQADAANLVGMLEQIAQQFKGKAVFTTSFGIEDQPTTFSPMNITRRKSVVSCYDIV